MKTIVPIHNAVNERAWKEIKEWERPYGSEEKYAFSCYLRSLMLMESDAEARGYILSLDYRRP